MNKILYRFIEGKHKFYGLVGIPEKNWICANEESCMYNESCMCQKYKAEVERIKSTSPEIINPEELSCINPFVHKGESEKWIIMIDVKCQVLKDNYIFNLPEGLEFKEEDVPLGDVQYPIKDYRKVVRIVKAEKEPEESYNIAIYVKGYYDADDLRKIADELDQRKKI